MASLNIGLYELLGMIGGLISFIAVWAWKLHRAAKHQGERITKTETKIEGHEAECLREAQENADKLREIDQKVDKIDSKVDRLIGYLEKTERPTYRWYGEDKYM